MAERVLVTGAAGFIGSHLCERLVGDGFRVRALCRYTSRRELGNLADVPSPVRDEIELVFGDLLDPDFVAASVRGCERVFHLAASVSVPYSFEDPRLVTETNVIGTLNVLTAARDVGVARVVHLSSSEVYGTAKYIPIDETHPLNVQSPYAASKVGADKLAEAFHLSYDLPVVIARPFNNFGPRQSQRGVIPTIVSQALAGPTVTLGALWPRRDFVFVLDTVDALVRLAVADEHAGETFNLATGRDVSVAELVDAVAELLGRPLEAVSGPERFRPEHSEVHRLVGDGRKLQAAIGWAPRTTLREGLTAVIEWLDTRAPGPERSEYVI